MSERFVGIDVGGTNVRSAVWSGGEPVVGVTSELPRDYESFLGALELLVGDEASSVGIGLPGRVSGGTVEWMPNIPYLDGRTLADDLSGLTGAPVRLANDAQLALLGEARFGAARGLSSAILVSVGTGIGGALMLRRKIVPGAHGTAGAFGWLPVGEAGGETAGDTAAGHTAGDTAAACTAEIGSWEGTASGRSLERRAARLQPPLVATGLVRAARSGREDAAILLQRFTREFATGLAGLASAFDPQLVVVSGGVSALVGQLLPQVTDAYRLAASPSVRDTPIVVAQNGTAAGSFGAAAYASEQEGAFLR